jgi:ribose transport system substrate-binding protein
MGLAIPYSARAGVFDPSKEPKDRREFYGTALVVTKDNVDDFYEHNIKNTPNLDFKDIWGRASGQIREG